MTQPHRWLRFTPHYAGSRPIAFGADYNPEQWPREVWDEDIALMRKAGVNIVTLAVFSWARLQPAEDRFDFEWLDEIMDRLQAGGIMVDLATASASPPPWLSMAHPETLPVDQEGHTLWQGARQHWRPTSPVFRRYALKLVEAMATRYAEHPALVAWHVSNELGCHNIHDYSEDAATSFRGWLRERYGSVEGLNHAWGTDFWSQRYGSFDEVLPPRIAASHQNPTQQLDFRRFSSDALRDYLREESEVLRRVTPDVPVTTNFMVMGETRGMDYASWAPEIDFVSNDHYRQDVDRPDDELSFSANLTSGVAGHRPWYLMEHATSAVNWQSVNRTKSTSVMIHDALSHVSHGADAVAFFQWRASAAGAEKYHSAMLPHAGEDSDLFRGVCELGSVLDRLGPVVGSTKSPAQVAILFDWDSWWASELDSHPTSLLRYRREALDWYSALLDAGISVDVVPASADLRAYSTVIAPVLYLVPDELAASLTAFVADGGHLVTTYFSGIADRDDRIRLGGYPGAFRDLLGIRVEEFSPLPEGASLPLSTGTSATLWSEPVKLTDDAVEVLASYLGGSLAGRPAVTLRHVGSGSASYVSTRLGIDGISAVLPQLLAAAGVASALPGSARGTVERVVRTDGEHDHVFLLNRTDRDVTVPDQSGELLLGSRSSAGEDILLPAHGVAVLRRKA